MEHFYWPNVQNWPQKVLYTRTQVQELKNDGDHLHGHYIEANFWVGSWQGNAHKRKLDFLGRPSCIITLFMCFEFLAIGLKPSFELWKEGGGGWGRYIKRSSYLGPRLGPNWLFTLWPWVNKIHLFVGSSGIRSHTKWVKLGWRF